MKQRLDYIDIAKGIAIILVVISHTAYPALMSYTLAFFVPVFFFCSGYTSSSLKEISLTSNFWHHAVKLLKPYFFFSVVLLIAFQDFSLRAVFGIFYSRYCLYPFGTQPDIVHFMTVGNYPLWFLTCMVVAYLLYYLIVYHPKYQYYIATFYLLLTVVMQNLPILLPWSIDTAFMMALFMFAGKLTRQYLPTLFERHPHLLVILSIVAYIALIPLCFDINLSVRQYGFSVLVCMIAALTGSVVLIYLSRLLEKTIVGKGLQQIGRHSLTLFCIQIPFILLGKTLAEWMLGGPADSQPTLVTTALIQASTAIICGYLISVLLQWNGRIKKWIF